MKNVTNKSLNDRRLFNRELLEFLGESLAALVITNYHLHQKRKQARIFRMVSQERKLQFV